MRARSTFRFVAVLLLLTLVGTAVYLYNNLDRIVADLIEERGSIATQSNVGVEGVTLRLRQGSGTIRGLEIANPPGFDGTEVLEFGEVSVTLDTSSLTSNPIIIDEILVQDAVLSIEQRGRENNVKAVLDALARNADQADAPADDTSMPKIVVRRFELRGARADVFVSELNEERSVDVPPVVITGIGEAENGVLAGQLAKQILTPVLQRTLESAAVESAKERVRDAISENADELSEDLLDRLRDKD